MNNNIMHIFVLSTVINIVINIQKKIRSKTSLSYDMLVGCQHIFTSAVENRWPDKTIDMYQLYINYNVLRLTYSASTYGAKRFTLKRSICS